MKIIVIVLCIMFLSSCGVSENNRKIVEKKLELKEKMYKMCVEAGGVPQAYLDYEINCLPKQGYLSK